MHNIPYAEPKYADRAQTLGELPHRFGAALIELLQRQWQREHGFLFRATAATLFGGAAVLIGLNIPLIGPVRPMSTPTAAAAPHQAGPQQGVTIANSGHVYVQGARVLRLDDSGIVALSSWGGGQFRWAVALSGDTRIVLSSGEIGTLADIKEGDYVAITGELSGASDLGVAASSIRLISNGPDERPVVDLREIEGS